MGLLRAPFITYDDVAANSEVFTSTYAPEGKIPVDIEGIAEFGLALDIVPVRGLMSSLNVDGFLSLDFAKIFVDEDILLRSPTRYRFTVAHEVGHVILHKDTLQALSISEPQDWLQFYLTLDEQDQGWFERQAYWFAGAVLVPEANLLAELDRAMEKLGQAGADPVGLSYNSRSVVAGSIAKRFMVSTGVVERRLREVGLW